MRITSTWRSASSSERRRGIALGSSLGGLALVVALGNAQAQGGAVLGQVHVIDRPGETTHDLGDAVVWLEAPRRLAFPAAAGGAPTTETILMRGREFIPHVRVVRAGGSVAFPNDDPFSHNVFSNTTFGGFDLGLYRHGQSKAAPFERPGIYPIYCNIHHRMVSFVVAVPTSWAGQPQDDGRFALRDVPPGRYVLHAWHERAGEVHQTVEVREGAPASVDLTLDARGYVPTPHPNKFGLPYTPTRADRY